MAERDRDDVELFAACLMPDHLHVVAGPRSVSLMFVDRFKSLTTRRAWEAGNRGTLWHPGWWDRQLREREFGEAVRYVARNPVAGGLVEHWEEWRWVWVAEMG